MPPSTRASSADPPRRAALVASVSALFALLAPALGAVSTPAGPPSVGTLRPSMIGAIQMLDDEGSSGRATDLGDLRDDVLGRGWSGADGTGVDVAVIDTGVAPVPGLDAVDAVLHGPDLSVEAGAVETAYVDTYGHGTHIAGIIAGQRPGQEGIAPGARIVSLKVAGRDGVTTVPQVVAAIDWVVEHHDVGGLDIRVVNLSLGQADVTTHEGDLLSAAVERAWRAGVVVVVAAGNSGDVQHHLDSPAISPFVVAVGTGEHEEEDEGRIPRWSARGDGSRDPDVVAPGQSIASYRVPGSTIDLASPDARVGDDLFRGTGTSQSAAVVSGVVAALLSAHPDLSPDEVKATLEDGAIRFEEVSRRRQGDGFVRGRRILTDAPLRDVAPQTYTSALSWLLVPADDSNQGVEDEQGLTGGGEVETGDLADSGATWSGGSWELFDLGATWSGATWSGATWSGATWSGATWSGATWSGATWSGATWSGATWSGATWSGATWSSTGWEDGQG